MPDISGELESLRRENARLRKLLKLTDAEAAATHGKTTTLSATASALTRHGPCASLYYSGNDCGQVADSGVPSVRFPGGVSYRSVLGTNPGPDHASIYKSASDTYVLPVTGRSTPYDSFTVTAHGGPSTAGDDDTGTLGAYVEPETGTAGTQSVTLQGDTTGTLSKVPSLGMTDLLAGEPHGVNGPVLRWGFGTDAGNSYDVASFDLSYTRYVLP